MKPYRDFFKRAVDIAVSGTALLVLLVPLGVVTVWLHFANKGAGAFFRQERPGKGGRIFRVIKFKSMTDERDANGNLLPDAQRLTRVGRFVRSTSVDELPQLWNVLKGDMSLVGPRPERRYFIDKIMEHDASYPLVFEMRPGLTSEATLYNGYTDTMEKMLTRLHMDIAYLKKRTLWTDVTIIFKTFASIVSGRKF